MLKICSSNLPTPLKITCGTNHTSKDINIRREEDMVGSDFIRKTNGTRGHWDAAVT